jgi:hypothetical protein
MELKLIWWMHDLAFAMGGWNADRELVKPRIDRSAKDIFRLDFFMECVGKSKGEPDRCIVIVTLGLSIE